MKRGRKPSGTGPARMMCLRVPTTAHEQIVALAAEERRTWSAMAVTLLEDALAARTKTTQTKGTTCNQT